LFRFGRAGGSREGAHDCPARAEFGAPTGLPGRARRGVSGALSPAIRYSGVESPSEVPTGYRAGAFRGIDGQAPRNGELPTPSGPEGSSGTQTPPGAVDQPDLSYRAHRTATGGSEKGARPGFDGGRGESSSRLSCATRTLAGQRGARSDDTIRNRLAPPAGDDVPEHGVSAALDQATRVLPIPLRARRTRGEPKQPPRQERAVRAEGYGPEDGANRFRIV